MSELEYLSVLNDEQKAAVVHSGSSLLILAGAGSGKTRVITTKIAYLIQQKNISPYKILAVTFTKKAAQEMKERAVKIEQNAQYCQIRTFHSFGSYFLRRYYAAANVDKNFTVYDDDDTVTLILKANPSITKKQATHYAHLISLAKDYCLLPDDPLLDSISSESFFRTVYEQYENRLRETGNVDFGDLILLPYLVLRDNENIRKSVHNQFKVIMVDEYQDSNVAQFKLLELLSGVKENSGTYVCVVGDDDQSIYKFRGAEVQNILNFQNMFPNTDVIKLEKNYRSTQEILSCAQYVVENNKGRLGKNLISARGKGKTPALVFLQTQDDETEFCADIILQSAKKGIPFSDWAILYRTNAQSLGFETEFMHKKIPYQVVGALKFYDREEVKDIISWLSFIVNPKDEISFRRIANKPARGLGEKSQDKIVEAGLGKSLLDQCKNISFSKKAKEATEEFVKLAESFISLLPDLMEDEKKKSLVESALLDENAEEEIETPAETEADETEKENSSYRNLSDYIKAIVKDSGLYEYYKEKDELFLTQKVLNLDELINSASSFSYSREGLLDFLDHVNLDRTLETEENSSTDKVTLITLHNTKGLEFKRVIITGMESGIFPRDGKDEADMEEERRLFYVGITRAMNELYFTSCATRKLYGHINYTNPSLFLNELDSKCLRVLGDVPEGFTLVKQPKQKQAKASLSEKYCKGAQVYHDDWGYGQIISAKVSDEGEYTVKVAFETGGIKTFMPEYQSHSLLVIE